MPLLFASLYGFVLFGHAAYARALLRDGSVSLALGPVQTPRAIMAALLLINGFGLSAFLWPNTNWVAFHAATHVILAGDELWRMRKARRRWPFFVNHLFFTWTLWMFRGTIVSSPGF